MKTKLSILIAALTLAALPVQAQTPLPQPGQKLVPVVTSTVTTSTNWAVVPDVPAPVGLPNTFTNPLPIDLSQGTVVGVQGALTRFFTLHDPTVQYYTNANTIEFEVGPSFHSSGGGASQNLSIAGYHRISPLGELGGNVEIETLTLGGQDVSLAAAHFRYRKDWDNIAGVIGIGAVHNIAERQAGPELELGAEGGFTDHLGWETRIGWTHDFLNRNQSQQLPFRIVAAMTYRF